MSSGDTSWVLACTALVMIMTPGVALFYGGLARRKNILSILMQCFFIMCLVGLQWVLFGYSLAFGPDTGYGIIGGLQWVGLNDVGIHDFPGHVCCYHSRTHGGSLRGADQIFGLRDDDSPLVDVCL